MLLVGIGGADALVRAGPPWSGSASSLPSRAREQAVPGHCTKPPRKQRSSASPAVFSLDCDTVTHIIGLRPFMSQLLCEQVVGRGLRRASYELTDEGKFSEEVAKVFGVPFEVIPSKADPKGGPAKKEKRHHVYAVGSKSQFEIRYPRAEGYTIAMRKRCEKLGSDASRQLSSSRLAITYPSRASPTPPPSARFESKAHDHRPSMRPTAADRRFCSSPDSAARQPTWASGLTSRHPLSPISRASAHSP